MTETRDLVARNRERQAALYGEPLGDLLGRVVERLDLTKARLAEILGLSAPMLSQLMSARRIKIGNPSAVRRLQELVELADEAVAGMAAPLVAERLAEVGSHTSAITISSSSQRRTPASAVRLVQGLLRAIASADDLQASAETLRPRYPEIAEFLRVYGAGRTEEAIAHFEQREHLL
ncbi:MAG: hypothetical protein ACRDN9_17505 [Streptosporangiaceae bacterium]